MIQEYDKLILLLFMYILSGIVPQLVLFLEYKKYSFKIMKLYSHFFIFPIIVFPFILYFFYDIIAYVEKSQFFLTHHAVLYSILIVVPFLGSILDIISGDRAIFEIKPTIVRSKTDSHSRKNLLEIFDKILDISIEIDELKLEIKDNPIKKHKEKLARLEEHRVNLRTAYNNSLSNFRKLKYRSFTLYTYFLLIFIFLILIVGGYLSLFILLKTEPVSNIDQYKSALNSLTIVLLLFSLWFPMRICFLHSKKYFFEKITMIGDLPLGLLIMGSCIYLLALYYNQYEKILMNVIGIITVIGGPILAFRSPQIMTKIFGFRATISTYIAFFLTIFLLLLPLL